MEFLSARPAAIATPKTSKIKPNLKKQQSQSWKADFDDATKAQKRPSSGGWRAYVVLCGGAPDGGGHRPRDGERERRAVVRIRFGDPLAAEDADPVRRRSGDERDFHLEGLIRRRLEGAQ